MVAVMPLQPKYEEQFKRPIGKVLRVDDGLAYIAPVLINNFVDFYKPVKSYLDSVVHLSKLAREGDGLVINPLEARHLLRLFSTLEYPLVFLDELKLQGIERISPDALMKIFHDEYAHIFDHVVQRDFTPMISMGLKKPPLDNSMFVRNLHEISIPGISHLYKEDPVFAISLYGLPWPLQKKQTLIDLSAKE